MLKSGMLGGLCRFCLPLAIRFTQNVRAHSNVCILTVPIIATEVLYRKVVHIDLDLLQPPTNDRERRTSL